MSTEISSKMHHNATKVTEEVLARFPQIKQIWTYASFPDHSNCRCTDYMITIEGLSRSSQVLLGDAIANYLIKNADRVGLNWLIWNRRIYRHQNTNRGHGWDDYNGPKPHTDHVHAEVEDKVYQPPKNQPPKDEDDMPSAEEIAKAIRAEFDKDAIPAGSDEADTSNKFWRLLSTYPKKIYDRLVESKDLQKQILAEIKKLPHS